MYFSAWFTYQSIYMWPQQILRLSTPINIHLPLKYVHNNVQYIPFYLLSCFLLVFFYMQQTKIRFVCARAVVCIGRVDSCMLVPNYICLLCFVSFIFLQPVSWASPASRTVAATDEDCLASRHVLYAKGPRGTRIKSTRRTRPISRSGRRTINM